MSRVSVGGLGRCGKVENPEEVVAEVESGEALAGGDEGPLLHYVINVPLVLLPLP